MAHAAGFHQSAVLLFGEPLAEPCPLLVSQHPSLDTLTASLAQLGGEWSVNHLCGQHSWEWVYLHTLILKFFNCHFVLAIAREPFGLLDKTKGATDALSCSLRWVCNISLKYLCKVFHIHGLAKQEWHLQAHNVFEVGGVGIAIIPMFQFLADALHKKFRQQFTLLVDVAVDARLCGFDKEHHMRVSLISSHLEAYSNGRFGHLGSYRLSHAACYLCFSHNYLFM
jgi:hypothetical protein